MQDSFWTSHWKRTMLLGMAGALVFLPFHWQWSVGIVTGLAAAVINHAALTYHIDVLLSQERFRPILFALLYLLRTAILAIPMLFAVLCPQFSNIWAAFAAMLLSKVLLYVGGFTKKEGDEAHDHHDPD